MNYEAGRVESDETQALPDYSEARQSRRRALIIGVVVALAALIAAAYFFTRDSGDAASTAAAKGGRAEQLASVTVSVPGRQTIERVVTATGTLAARREMPVGVAGEGGMITRVLVEPGQWVSGGQVLAVVDRSVQVQTIASLASSVNVARADAELAQSELERANQLVERGFISKADIQRRTATRDAANARVKVAQAQLQEARARTGRLDIRAPAAGLILTRQAEPGQIVSSGSGILFRMAQGGQMEMRAQVSENDLTGLRVGARASVTPVGSSEAFAGEVWQVSPVIDPQTRQGIARIALRYDPALRPGGFASAAITSGATVAPMLPESAVQSDGKGNYVYVLDGENRAVRRDVRVGAVTDAGVSIASGLGGTERVVMSAAAFLAPGQKVKPILQSRGS